MAKTDEILQMALIGYAEQRRLIDAKIAELQEQLAGPTPNVAASEDGVKPKRKMTAAGKRHIREALKKRWAAFRAGKTEKAAPKAAKKKLSPARKAALLANLKKARAARAAKRTAGGTVPF